MYFNYRIVRKEDDQENILYLTECHYQRGNLMYYVEPIDIFNRGLYSEDMEEMKWMIAKFTEALNKPVVIIRKDNTMYEEVKNV